jgi:hypothetical protein
MRLLAVALVASLMSMFSVAKADENTRIDRWERQNSARVESANAWLATNTRVRAEHGAAQKRIIAVLNLTDAKRGLCYVDYDISEFNAIRDGLDRLSARLEEFTAVEQQIKAILREYDESQRLRFNDRQETEYRNARAGDRISFRLVALNATVSQLLDISSQIQQLVARLDFLEFTASQSCVLPEEGDLSGSEVVNSAVYGESGMSGR